MYRISIIDSEQWDKYVDAEGNVLRCLRPATVPDMVEDSVRSFFQPSDENEMNSGDWIVYNSQNRVSFHSDEVFHSLLTKED